MIPTTIPETPAPRLPYVARTESGDRRHKWPQVSTRGEERRAAIVEAIREKPLHFRALLQRTGIASGTLKFHLSVLSRRKVIRLEYAGCKLYACLPSSGWTASQALAVDDPGVPEVVRLVGDRVMCQRDILEASPWNRSTTQHRLARAVKHGLLAVREQGRYLFYAKPGTPTHGLSRVANAGQHIVNARLPDHVRGATRGSP